MQQRKIWALIWKSLNTRTKLYLSCYTLWVSFLRNKNQSGGEARPSFNVTDDQSHSYQGFPVIIKNVIRWSIRSSFLNESFHFMNQILILSKPLLRVAQTLPQMACCTSPNMMLKKAFRGHEEYPDIWGRGQEVGQIFGLYYYLNMLAALWPFRTGSQFGSQKELRKGYSN